ncbi:MULTISPECIES: ABC transporter permease [unclassified Xanthobacter]|uniref:ABC transporter permease n=1 Tax=unclassified Xanthobacter TaxID=2623496 RepID=UPI001EDDED06|nr:MULTISPECIES: ABC transporter permease [unclassified Xanthobacter]
MAPAARAGAGFLAPVAAPWAFLAALLVLALLVASSLLIGVGDLAPADLFSADAAGQEALLVLMASRVPRTLALLFAGLSMGVAAVIMQMLFRNRFVEPTTAGTAEAARLGLVVVMLAAPDLPVFGKMLVASAFALAGTFLFLRIVDRLSLRTTLIVPLVGLILGGVIDAASTFLAYRFDLLQALAAWTTGDFSGVLRGRYELLWISVPLSILAYLAADRFTVAGLGDAFATNLGLDYRKVVTLGLVIVSLVTAACVVTAGTVPFLGLIVANVVALVLGDHLRRTLPWIAVSGAGFLLACDIIGRLVRFPYEIPVGTVAGVLGSAVFLYLLLGRRPQHG